MYDFIIVGGVCAGLAAAMRLTRRSYDVLLVDRGKTPADGSCAAHIAQPGLFLLEQWGVLGPLRSRGGRSAESVSLVHSRDVHSLGESSLTVRRSLLNEALSDAARASGVEVRERFTVKNVVWNEDRVCGIVGLGDDGHAICEQARVVIGADGRQSVVARTIGPATVHDDPSDLCSYYAFWAGLDEPGPALYLSDDATVAVLPTDEGLTSVVVARPIQMWAQYKRAPETTHTEGLSRIPDLADRVSKGTRTSRFFGTADLAACVRESAGPGWGLLGDASRHAGGVFGRSVTHGLIQAELLAGRQSIHAGLSRYEAQAEAALGEMERLSTELCRPGGGRKHRIEAFEQAAARQLQWVETFHSMGTRGSGLYEE